MDVFLCVSCIQPLVVLSPQYFEVPFDSNMNRTKNRPLVRGQIRWEFFLSLCLFNSDFLMIFCWHGSPISTFYYFKRRQWKVIRVYRRGERVQQLSVSWSSAQYGRSPATLNDSYWAFQAAFCTIHCRQMTVCCCYCSLAERHFSRGETWPASDVKACAYLQAIL